MPSPLHEALVELFRARPQLAAELVQAAGGPPLPAFHQARTTEAAFGDLNIADYRADVVTLLEDPDGQPLFAITIEVQLGNDPRKPYTWPLYLATLRARRECPVLLIVVAPDPEVATWAVEPVELGPGFTFRPLVFGPQLIPWITSPEEARASPELAVLSAVAHGNEPGGLQVALLAVATCHGLPPEPATLYLDLILARLNAAAREALEALMMSGKQYEFQSDFARRYVALGEKQGREEGLEEGVALGRAELLVKAMDLRGLEIPEEARARVLATRDVAVLERWLERALVATRWEEVFAPDDPEATPKP